MVVDGGQVAGAAGLELFDPVFHVRLGAVAGVEPLGLPGGRVGGERAVLPVGVPAELGRLAGGPGDAAGDDSQVVGQVARRSPPEPARRIPVRSATCASGSATPPASST